MGDAYGSLRALDDAATTLQSFDEKDPAQPNRKAQWISDARALFKKPGWEGFKGVLYYNKTSKYPNCRWFVDSSQASLTTFSGMANDVYYTRDEP